MVLKEKLDFSFSFEDFSEVYNIATEYLNDRIDMYNDLFTVNNDYTVEDTTAYIDFFITPLLEESRQHPYLYRILHFLQRDYEFFTLPKVYGIKESLLHYMSIEPDDIESLESFLDYEYDTLNDMVDLWDKFYTVVEEYPILTLSTMSKDSVDGIPIYFEENTDPYIKENFYIFIKHLSGLFPNELRRLDAWILCDPKYIEFSGGKGTFAFYMKDSVFVRSHIEEKDKEFYIETLYHEFFHFLFELLPERIQLYWYDKYQVWTDNGIGMTRKEGKNDVEELFADVGSLLCTGVHDFIQEPNPIIKDFVKSIVKNYFNVVF